MIILKQSSNSGLKCGKNSVALEHGKNGELLECFDEAFD
jgi:hypothetical protein